METSSVNQNFVRYFLEMTICVPKHEQTRDVDALRHIKPDVRKWKQADLHLTSYRTNYSYWSNRLFTSYRKYRTTTVTQVQTKKT